jgi:hypothetical protein
VLSGRKHVCGREDRRHGLAQSFYTGQFFGWQCSNFTVSHNGCGQPHKLWWQIGHQHAHLITISKWVQWHLNNRYRVSVCLGNLVNFTPRQFSAMGGWIYQESHCCCCCWEWETPNSLCLKHKRNFWHKSLGSHKTN